MINYNIDYKGILHIYINNYILCEISECKNMNDEEIKKLVNDYLEESDVKQ